MDTVANAANPHATATQEERDAIYKRVAHLKFAMLSTRENGGGLSARPVTTQQADPNGTLWFFIALNGHLARTVQRDPHIVVAYSDVGDSFYASFSGTGTCVRDVAKARNLWNPMAAAWFPNGPEDPNLGLLRVDVQAGDTWEAKSGKLVQLFSIAKAVITKTPPDLEGDHRHFVA